MRSAVSVALALAFGFSAVVHSEDTDARAVEISVMMSAQIAFVTKREDIRKRDPLKKRLRGLPKVSDALTSLRTKLRGIESANTYLVAERRMSAIEVLAVRVESPTPEQTEPIYAGFRELRNLYASDTAEAAIVSDEIEELTYEYLRYPNPYKFLIASDFRGKVRLFECFLAFPDKEVVSAAGGLIRYGNDFPAEDIDVQADSSWARERYRHLFRFAPLSFAK